MTDLEKLESAVRKLASDMTSAIKQLGTDKSVELRVRRLEDVVFGSKH